MDKPTSSLEIMEYLPGTRVMLYSDLDKFASLNDVLSPTGQAVFLYETSKGYGHWCCVFRRNKKTVEVFDSYGYVPDDELKWIGPNLRKRLGQDEAHLSALLLDDGSDVIYNDYILQGENTATCGRHCVSRLLHKKKTIDQYKRFLEKKPISPDEYVLTVMPP